MYQIYEVYNGQRIPVSGYNSEDLFTCEVWMNHLKCDHPKFDYIIEETDHGKTV